MYSNKTVSYVLSLLIHIAIFLIFIFYKNPKFILPSQSDGITLSVISSQEVKTEIVKQNILPIKTPTLKPIFEANIKLKSDKLANRNESNNKVEIKKYKNLLVINDHKKKVIINKKDSTENLTNELLSSLHDIKTNGKSNGQNIGGNQLGSANNKVKINNYADLVINLVRPHVVIPDNVENKLVAIVKVVLLPNMNVYSAKIMKSSGNIVYDNNVINAINIVKKFPDIPKGDKWLDYRVLNLTFKSE